MKRLIEMHHPDGSTVIVAVEIPEMQARDEISRTGALDSLLGAPAKVDQNYGIVSDMIFKCAKPIVESFSRLAKEEMAPKKACAEFGLSFNGKGSVYLVEASMEGSIKVSLEWELGSRSD